MSSGPPRGEVPEIASPAIAAHRADHELHRGHAGRITPGRRDGVLLPVTHGLGGAADGARAVCPIGISVPASTY